MLVFSFIVTNWLNRKSKEKLNLWVGTVCVFMWNGIPSATDKLK